MKVMTWHWKKSRHQMSKHWRDQFFSKLLSRACPVEVVIQPWLRRLSRIQIARTGAFAFGEVRKWIVYHCSKNLLICFCMAWSFWSFLFTTDNSIIDLTRTQIREGAISSGTRACLCTQCHSCGNWGIWSLLSLLSRRYLGSFKTNYCRFWKIWCCLVLASSP